MFDAMMLSACDACVLRRLALDGDSHRRADVGRQVGGSLSNELDQALFEKLHQNLMITWAASPNRVHAVGTAKSTTKPCPLSSRTVPEYSSLPMTTFAASPA